MQNIPVGVVGVGRLGQLHARLYREVEGTRLIGVYDTDAPRAETLANELGVRRFETFDDLVAATEAINIVVPTIFHFELGYKALAAGKHIFIEKPITTTTEEAGELIALAAKQQRVLQVGHIERFNAALRALDDFPLAPRFIESHRLASFDPRGTDVAVVLDLMIHDIDIILALVKSPLTRIDANGVAVVSEEPDIANARLQFANGCVANVTASRISQKKMRKMRIFQRDAYVSLDFLQGLTEVFRLVSPEEAMAGGGFPVVLGKLDQGARQRHIVYEKLQAPEGNALKMELQSFINAIRTGMPPPVTGEDGRRALEVATTITEVIKRASGEAILKL
ncbi:MAG: Gfo/Idh/MocA family oxidoreductase [candidate division KSB1 bacterium]|nr:Gfo/Idh/MocA family oxidoreductase [candidate division KSB1 bacterium]MDZ7364701.1 Gfo/Idh/MocA family oxidoreductase [candidate division KSB1 bacterium]MDZ7402551.1 Gfo/Idh/MocA family oxidoreductase [candidate division KSB1 bacterium]